METFRLLSYGEHVIDFGVAESKAVRPHDGRRISKERFRAGADAGEGPCHPLNAGRTHREGAISVHGEFSRRKGAGIQAGYEECTHAGLG